jgi:hypothetical protein
LSTNTNDPESSEAARVSGFPRSERFYRRVRARSIAQLTVAIPRGRRAVTHET